MLLGWGFVYYSVLKNIAPGDLLDFYIFEDSISAQHKTELKNLVKHTPHHIYFLAVPFERMPHLQIHHAHLSRAAFARLLMASLLPQEVDKVIYLDCDVMACTSLSGLYSMALDGNIVGRRRIWG